MIYVTGYASKIRVISFEKAFSPLKLKSKNLSVNVNL